MVTQRRARLAVHWHSIYTCCDEFGAGQHCLPQLAVLGLHGLHLISYAIQCNPLLGAPCPVNRPPSIAHRSYAYSFSAASWS